MDWKDALGLALTDPGVDSSMWRACRDRLLSVAAQEQAVTPLLAVCTAGGLLRAGGKQRTDSTPVLAAMRQLNRLGLVGETLAHTLYPLLKRAPDWVAAPVPEGFVRR